MIYSDRHKVAFIAIPKNANTSARNIFSERIGNDFFPITRHESDFKYIERIIDDNNYQFDPELHTGHLPLKVLKEIFPNFFHKLETWQLFAIVRDPFDRFPSSFVQYLTHMQYVKNPAIDIDIEIDFSKLNQTTIEKYLDMVIDDLSTNGANYKEKTCFMPQSEYIYFNDRQFVKNLFDVRDVDSFKKAIEKHCNLKFGTFKHLNKNRRAELLPGFPMKSVVRQILPKPMKRYISNYLNSKLQIRNKYKNVFEKSNVTDFVEKFYRKDIEMYSMNKNKIDN